MNSFLKIYFRNFLKNRSFMESISLEYYAEARSEWCLRNGLELHPVGIRTTVSSNI